MSTQQQTADWVKWAAGICMLLSASAFGYAISTEHRLTNTETTVAQHLAEAKETKADVYQRLNAQDQTQKEVLQAVNDVKVDMAAIRGALGIPKPSAK
ncbi:hypothetical protein [Hymenobacter sp. CRA2]|uniref:hypothetical protein n=1 Tax=Hymenobacter sp. CRA2 TaxID=1955620 RepID=UPI00098FC7CB|nr:hypothetical protein [Hymenobacter sp. CRA2]OON67819.1 hypothetical protein B0919_16675 [Hymenobacter sp. CRA2]